MLQGKIAESRSTTVVIEIYVAREIVESSQSSTVATVIYVARENS